MNTSSWDQTAMGYSTVETLLEEVSNHMAASNLSRHCRVQSVQKPGGSMRIVKSGSSSNSPRTSMGLGRRMTDGAYRRRLAMMDQNLSDTAPYLSSERLQPPPSQATRPVSWHPTSHWPNMVPYQPTDFQAVPQSQTSLYLFDVPPSPVAYSGYTSPASTFSPVSMSYNGYEQQNYFSRDGPHSNQPSSCAMNAATHPEQLAQTYSGISATNTDPTMYSHFDWNNFATNGFGDSTAPPTPENFLPIQHPEPTFPAEDSISYHALDDTEDGGEELIGMGLYDTPEAAKSPLADPHLHNYRNLMMSQLLGSAYRVPEPIGKGLKLEETWNPPNDDEDDDDSEQDGDGESEDEGEFECLSRTQHSDDIHAARKVNPSALVGVPGVGNGISQQNMAPSDYAGWV